ncbi:site-2 protease family protein [Leptolyngbyaceae cyanobacterium CCMR0082]|uniref:Zinc metalloprotease n=2 Tax=Adonisia turfae TaxID=2950184 RepID=A0A6M0SE36_9CYAN|nr:site-2 protease family protein [Adonisia turfae]MDV3351326.1 site-2 protease family protein [Leptothoe sp. LEGE 181152]NEZ60215.1 site-2 protease family protein [Adonisia turfae CCMR0081]NEZ66241.1 site-2 protease family protein [Adonisia turfae CCMR0082]
MQSGWRVGAIFGIPLFVDNSWFFILLLMTFAYGGDLLNDGFSFPVAAVVGLGMALLLFGSVLLHELGHSLVARRQGIQVNSITLFLFGGIASIDKESKTPGQAFQVAIAGPLVSFFLFLLLSLMVFILPEQTVISQSVGTIAQINLVLTLFNLIPGLPLDGGQVLKALVWKITGSRAQGVRWAARVGQLLGWMAITIGIYGSLATRQIGFLWFALLGWFAVRNAGAYNRVSDLQDAITSLKARDASVREFKVIDANLTLRAFADHQLLNEEKKPIVYFAASNGRYRGMVSLDDLRQIERSRWETMTLAEMAHPLLDVPHVREETPLSKVITDLEENELRRITVLSPADAVAGTIDRGDVVRALAKRLNFPISEAIIDRIKEEGAYPSGLQLAAIARNAE